MINFITMMMMQLMIQTYSVGLCGARYKKKLSGKNTLYQEKWTQKHTGNNNKLKRSLICQIQIHDHHPFSSISLLMTGSH